MRPGEQAVIQCPHCGTEFELTLEPRAAQLAAWVDTSDTDITPVRFCPYCGGVVAAGDHLEE